ncbi:MAG: hypothetical protein CEE38_09045 [Planctomycetes bacterium B3_Pla]|nr:MAG: hypothetical protein CEE38_09045 [Planctomycetes bacterium B3_Pla]
MNKSTIMGLYDRDYTQEGFQSQYRHAPQMRFRLPKLTPVVKWLLIINISVFVTTELIRPLGAFVYGWFQLDATTVGRAAQLWRLITYQFLHEPGSFFHILMNMIGLFFLGPTLERHWGSRRFLPFYLGCGIVGALFYLLLVAVRFLPPIPMIGASGAILGMLAACAILFPQFVVIFFIFPVPIRVAAVVLTAAYFLIVITRGDNAGGNACHLAGMAAGAAYVFSESWRGRFTAKIKAGRWEKQRAAHRDLETELDRILKKVHDSGIQSLTSKEKRTLKEATRAEQTRGRF